MNSRTRSFAMLLLCACLAQGAWAQINVSGPGFLPDESGTNLDNPQSRKVETSVVSDSTLISQTQAGQDWVRQMPAGTFLVQHTIYPTYAEANAWLQAHPTLRLARIVANYLPNLPTLKYSVVSGPFSSLGDASAYADSPGVPKDPQIRSARFMKEQFQGDISLPAQQQKIVPGTVIKDCPECPEMVVLPSGSFLMGSPPDPQPDPFSNEKPKVIGTPDEKPQHRVQIQSFAIGKYEVTQEQWFAVMGNNPSANKGRTLPVETVSWDDVQQFISKLNQKTGQKYRLPSEAEWEYAARAGTTTEWSFGNDESKLGNYAWNVRNTGRNTQVVGQKLPNAFGLFDMHGNVWEWTQDCWHENYAGAPTDGSAWTTGCSGNYRVLRGGSWGYVPADLRSAIRIRSSPGSRNDLNGFRLARTP